MRLKRGSFILGIKLFIMSCLAFRLFAQTPASAPVSSEDVKYILDAEYKASGLRDPFQTYIIPKVEDNPDNKPVAPPPDPGRFDDLEVTGIFWGADFPQAIIDGKVYKVGDKIKDAEIKKIDKDGIILLAGGREYNLVPPALSKPKQDGNSRKPRGGER